MIHRKNVCTINGRKYISSHDFNVFKQYLLRTIVNAYVFLLMCITYVCAYSIFPPVVCIQGPLRMRGQEPLPAPLFIIFLFLFLFFIFTTIKKLK